MWGFLSVALDLVAEVFAKRGKRTLAVICFVGAIVCSVLFLM